jgi:hypothetical protein
VVTNVLAGGRNSVADHGPGLWDRVYDDGSRVITNVRVAGHTRDRAANWLRIAMAALAVLATTAAIVSYQAQFRMVLAFKHVRDIAALQAGIPDVAALVFAALGIALALHGKRAVRARLLNVAAVATSVAMNLLAAGHGWKALAIWALAPVSYAVTSDTLIGVLRAHTLAKQRELNTELADDEATPLAVLGKVMLYGARLAIAPGSTLSGARRAILNAAPVPQKPEVETPAAEAHQVILRQLGPVEPVKTIEPAKPKSQSTKTKGSKKSAPRSGGTSKQAELIKLAVEKHNLAGRPLSEVSKLATRLAGDVGLHPATARRVLVAHARALQDGGAR